jgi:hypothetical protein
MRFAGFVLRVTFVIPSAGPLTIPYLPLHIRNTQQ